MGDRCDFTPHFAEKANHLKLKSQDILKVVFHRSCDLLCSAKFSHLNRDVRNPLIKGFTLPPKILEVEKSMEIENLKERFFMKFIFDVLESNTICKY